MERITRQDIDRKFELYKTVLSRKGIITEGMSIVARKTDGTRYRIEDRHGSHDLTCVMTGKEIMNFMAAAIFTLEMMDHSHHGTYWTR